MPLAEAFGFTNIKVDGYEADDVIASLTKRAPEQDLDVMVVSATATSTSWSRTGCA